MQGHQGKKWGFGRGSWAGFFSFLPLMVWACGGLPAAVFAARLVPGVEIYVRCKAQ